MAAKITKVDFRRFGPIALTNWWFQRKATRSVAYFAPPITVEHGLSTPDHEEAATKAAIVAAAERVVVLCDSSKIGVDRTMQFAKLTDIDVLVTDADITDEQRAQIEAAHVEVVVA